jgi:GTP-binding protein
MQWLAENQIPFVLIFTKTDKLSKNIITKNIEEYKLEMLKKWSKLPEIFITSSKEKTGLSEIITYIKKLTLQFKEII